MPQYVVVLAAESDARFRDEPAPFRATSVPTPVGPVELIFRTRYAEEGFEAAVPREMWIDARGETRDDVPLVNVISAYADAAAGFLPMIALSTNAWVGDIEPKIAYDATPGLVKREYFQNFVREERGALPPTRRIVNVEATVALLRAVRGDEGRDRLTRATVQYALALNHWYPGHETLALAHLFIGMEALTRLALKRELTREGITVEDLAARWGIDERRADQRRGRLDAEVRRRILFRGDHDTATKAREARNGFTHSFLDFAEVRELAESVVQTTARYLREAIFEFSGLEDDVRAVLTAPPFHRPLRSHFRRYMWGDLVGEGDDLAAPGQEYPMLRWSSGLKSLAKDPNDADRHILQPDENMKVRTGQGISFEPRRWEMYAAAGADFESGKGDDGGSTVETEIVRADNALPDLLAAVGALAMQLGGGEPVERPRHDLEVVALFDRCRSTFAAVRVLIEAKFVQEAVMLGRSLFIYSLMLAEFAAGDDRRRASLSLGWSLKSLADFEAVLREAATRRGEDISAELEAVAQRRAQLELYARRYEVEPRPWTPDERALADAHGRGDEYLDFLLADQFVSGSTMAAQERYAMTDDGVIGVGGPHADVDTWSKPAALFAAYSLLHASRAVCKILAWPEPPELASLLERADEIQESLDN